MIYEVWTLEKPPRIIHGGVRDYATAEALAATFRQINALYGRKPGATVRRGRRPYTLKPDRR
jgi:hypothetical protein